MSIFNIFSRKKSPQAFQQQGLLSALPQVEKWIDRTLAQHASQARPVRDFVREFGFSRLPQFYSPDILSRMKVVVVDKVPVPPLSKLGLPGFDDFEKMDAAGITYKDTYFVKAGEERRESLHAHELVHTLQWEQLGPQAMLAMYAAGLSEKGYRDSPLEVMAYDLVEKHFDTNKPINVEEYVSAQLQALQRQILPGSVQTARRGRG